MVRRKIFFAVRLLEVKTKNADRIMQTIPGLAAYGHFYCRPSHTKFIQQADDYNPSVKEIPDDILTAVANAIVVRNPALMMHLTEDKETGEYIDQSENDYKEPATVRGCP